MSYGLLRAAWRSAGEVCEIRAIARLRETLLAEQASWVQRMQKALVQMNIQLTEVLTDVMGMTGQAILRDIVAGERDPEVLARHRHTRVKASREEVVRALTGNWRDEHRFVLKQALGMYDDIGRRLAECDAKLQALLGQRAQAQVDVGRAPKANTRGEAFVDQGQQRYEEQQRQRSIAALKRRAATLGFEINPIQTAS